MYKDILRHKDHREYQLPQGPWIMMQKWEHLLFMHFPVKEDLIERHLPPELELDTYDGNAWISIIPFKVRAMRMRKMPQLPYFGYFLELNVRTYVKKDGIAGVYFFSLDASKLHAAAGGRIATLPYYYAKMNLKKKQDEIIFSSMRKGKSEVGFMANYHPVGDTYHPDKGSLDYWLMERYFLYSYRNGTLFRGDIHHKKWEVQRAEANVKKQTMTPFLGGNSYTAKPMLHYVQSKQALFWMIKRNF
ncbi:YqjF family protein [Virgibacillus indicus]|nr:DUF2071 domain-containing protein [Virgibacillus indicus]